MMLYDNCCYVWLINYSLKTRPCFTTVYAEHGLSSLFIIMSQPFYFQFLCRKIRYYFICGLRYMEFFSSSFVLGYIFISISMLNSRGAFWSKYAVYKYWKCHYKHKIVSEMASIHGVNIYLWKDIGIPIIKIRQSHGCLSFIFMMGIPIDDEMGLLYWTPPPSDLRRLWLAVMFNTSICSLYSLTPPPSSLGFPSL